MKSTCPHIFLVVASLSKLGKEASVTNSQWLCSVFFQVIPNRIWKLGKLNHVAIAVPDIEQAAVLYRDILGAAVSEKHVSLLYLSNIYPLSTLGDFARKKDNLLQKF